MNATESFTAVKDFTAKGMDRMSSLGQLNLRIFERLAARQADAMNLAVEHGMRIAKIATDAKGVSEYFKGQVEAAKDFNEVLMNESKVNMQIAGQTRDEYRVWFEKSLGEVTADLRKAMPAAA